MAAALSRGDAFAMTTRIAAIDALLKIAPEALVNEPLLP
jgi:hypothetical protein